ncbi:UNVERIFIED_CONTAM: hypothetical protein NCL1_35345 [Trichonephila clavipes]
MELRTRMVRRHVLKLIQVVFLASRWSNLRLAPSWGAHIGSVHSSTSYWSITWRDGMGTLNSASYISDVLRRVDLPFIRALRNLTF